MVDTFKHHIETKVPAHEKTAVYKVFLDMIEKRNISTVDALKKYLDHHQKELEEQLVNLNNTATNNDERRKVAEEIKLFKAWQPYLKYL